jgi:drug/metabolite transporter (DMT)-like permease
LASHDTTRTNPALTAPAGVSLWRVHGALVLVQIFFGLHYLAAKLVLTEVPPRLWALIRVSCAALILLGVARGLGRRLPTSPKVLGQLAFFSLFGVVINQLCFVEGLYRTTPMHSSIIMTTIPVSTLLFAVMLGRERLDGRKILSLAVAIGGVLLVIRPSAAEVADVRLLGDALTLINALSYAFFLVISRRLLSRVDPLGATAVILAFGSLGMLLPGLAALPGFDPGQVAPRTWVLGLFIVLFPTAAAYFLNYWALARLDSSIVAFFIYLQPLIATSLSILFLGERLTLSILAGASLVFGSVYLALRRRKGSG